MSLERISKNNGKLEIDSIGIYNASTFSGFCQKHDDEIFACIEKRKFEYSGEQCFKLAFRSFSRERYTKSALANMYDVHSSLDKGKPLSRLMEIQEQAFLTNIGAQAGLRDNDFHKKYFDQYLENHSHEDVRAFVIEFSEPFPVMVSGSVNPDFDFSNKRIQDLSDLDVVPDILSVTSFYDGEKGLVVLSWLKHCHATCETLIRSLLDKPSDKIPIFILQYFFSNFENIFISPKWRKTINQSEKDKIVDISFDNTSLFVEPHGKSISRHLLNIRLPVISTTKVINWVI